MKREVIIIPFPYSDLSGFKKRPALVIADWGSDDVVCCQITSKQSRDNLEVSLANTDFENGGLPVISNIRPNKIFTVHKPAVIRSAGTISKKKYDEVIEAITNLIA